MLELRLWLWPPVCGWDGHRGQRGEGGQGGREWDWDREGGQGVEVSVGEAAHHLGQRGQLRSLLRLNWGGRGEACGGGGHSGAEQAVRQGRVGVRQIVLHELMLGHGGHGATEVRDVLPQHLLEPLDVIYGASERLHLAALALQIRDILFQVPEAVIDPPDPRPLPQVPLDHAGRLHLLDGVVMLGNLGCCAGVFQPGAVCLGGYFVWFFPHRLSLASDCLLAVVLTQRPHAQWLVRHAHDEVIFLDLKIKSMLHRFNSVSDGCSLYWFSRSCRCHMSPVRVFGTNWKVCE